MNKTYRTVRRLVGRRVRWMALRWFRNHDMGRLHDVLAEAGLTGRYRLACGTLLGWAREDRLLPWDPDVDFFMHNSDRDMFLARGVPALRAAGFRPVRLFRNNDDEITEVSFSRHLCQYDFFFTFPAADPRLAEYFAYTWDPHNDEGPRVQITNQFRTQPWECCDLLGRVWMKPVDHDLELTEQYGTWRVPQKDYVHTESKQRARQEPWRITHHDWATASASVAVS